MVSGPIIAWQMEGGKVEAVTDFIFLDSKIIVDNGTVAMKLKMLATWKKSCDKPRHENLHTKKQRLHFANKGP